MTRTILWITLAHLLDILILATSTTYHLAPLPFPNSPPIANADSYSVHGNTLINSLMANDSDPDRDAISMWGVVTQPAHGPQHRHW